MYVSEFKPKQPPVYTFDHHFLEADLQTHQLQKANPTQLSCWRLPTWRKFTTCIVYRHWCCSAPSEVLPPISMLIRLIVRYSHQ